MLSIQRSQDITGLSGHLWLQQLTLPFPAPNTPRTCIFSVGHTNGLEDVDMLLQAPEEKGCNFSLCCGCLLCLGLLDFCCCGCFVMAAGLLVGLRLVGWLTACSFACAYLIVWLFAWYSVGCFASCLFFCPFDGRSVACSPGCYFFPRLLALLVAWLVCWTGPVCYCKPVGRLLFEQPW